MTYSVQRRSSFDASSLKKDHPEIYEAYRRSGAPFPRVTVKGMK